MNNEAITIKIDFINNRTVQFQLFHNESLLNSDSYTSNSQSINLDTFSLWIYSNSKEIFALPHHLEINILINDSNNIPTTLQPFITTFKSVISNTRNEVVNLRDYKNHCSLFDGRLFLNLDESPFLYQLFNYSSSINSDRSFHDPCSALNKRSNLENTPAINIRTLVDFILTHKIGKVFCHNISYLGYFFETHQLYLLTILEHLGVTFVIVDFDTYNQGNGHYYLKKFFNNEKQPHFSIMPHIERYWDNSLGLKNIQYFPIPFKINENHETERLSVENDILITTWSRIDRICTYLKPILLFLDHVDEETIFFDYQMLFHSMAHILLYETQLSQYEKMLFYKIFSQIYYHTNSLLKFEILENIHTQKTIHLYGDETWELFFPNYYKGRLNISAGDSFKEILNQKPYIHLLMNSNYNYFENNPMMIRVLNLNTPYLNFNSVVRIPELEGMNSLEYSSINELNLKINNIQQFTHNPSYNESKHFLARTMNICIDNFFQNIFHTEPNQNSAELFNKLIQRHDELFKAQYTNYLHKNLHRIQECMIKLIKQEYKSFNIEQSKMMNRGFMKKLIPIYNRLLTSDAFAAMDNLI